jgi:hypothetical protein
LRHPKDGTPDVLHGGGSWGAAMGAMIAIMDPGQPRVGGVV